MPTRFAIILAPVLILLAGAEQAPPHWSQDPDCQATFFAILEGCYREGMPNEVVDAIITPPAGSDPSVQHCFVFRCRLCHAAYDALVTYRRRAAFLTDPSSPAIDHFGSTNADELRWPPVLANLRSTTPSTRVMAMGAIMRPWIAAHYRRQHLSAAALEQRLESLMTLAREGSDLLLTQSLEPGSPYTEWGFYGGCQACEAASDLLDLLNEQRQAEAAIAK